MDAKEYIDRFIKPMLECLRKDGAKQTCTVCKKRVGENHVVFGFREGFLFVHEKCKKSFVEKIKLYEKSLKKS